MGRCQLFNSCATIAPGDARREGRLCTATNQGVRRMTAAAHQPARLKTTDLVDPPGTIPSSARRPLRDRSLENDGVEVRRAGDALADARSSKLVNRLAAAGHPSHGVRSTQTGMQFDPLLHFDVWKAVGARISTYASASAWWLGDWLAFGQMKYGRHYRDAIALTGLEYQTLRNYAVVARRFPMSRRRDDLSFQHHAEVCALSDEQQAFWLDLSAEHHWSKNELRRRKRAALPSTRLGPGHIVVRLNIEPERERRWRVAAERCHRGLDAWVTHVADEAANASSSISRPANR
jgi:hypothetical protein